MRKLSITVCCLLLSCSNDDFFRTVQPEISEPAMEKSIEPLIGCTSNLATNFNPKADNENGRCIFDQCLDESGDNVVKDKKVIDEISKYKKKYGSGSHQPKCNICDPFGGGKKHAGLKAFLYEGDAQMREIEDFINKGIKHKKAIILPDLNIPPRTFTQGFGNGKNKLKNLKGELLVEWFLLDMESSLSLLPEDKEGYYLIQSLSDDGSRVEIEDNGVWKKIVEINRPTAPLKNCHDNYDRIGISSSAWLVRMERGMKLNLRVKYFQGPRENIAMVLSWKKMADLDEFTDIIVEYEYSKTSCGVDKFKVLKSKNFSVSGTNC